MDRLERETYQVTYEIDFCGSADLSEDPMTSEYSGKVATTQRPSESQGRPPLDHGAPTPVEESRFDRDSECCKHRFDEPVL
jgi:hypothetical protein